MNIRQTSNRRRTAAALTLAAAAFVAGCGSQSESDLLASAKTAIDKKELKTAVIQLKSALQKNPQSGVGRYLLGDALLKSGDPAAAAVELEKAQDLHYNDDAVLPLLAKALLATGQAKKLTTEYGRTVLNDPHAAADLKALVALAYLGEGLPERSEAAMNAALQLDSQNVSAGLLQARSIASRGNLDEALAKTEAILKRQPQRPDAWRLKGELLWIGKNDIDGAIAAFREILKTEPQYLMAHSALISLMLQKRDIPGLKSQFALLKKALPNLPETRFYEAQIALIDKDYKRARENVQLLLKFAPDNAAVLQLAGAVESQGGSLLQTQAHLNKALQMDPSLPLARRLLAESYLRAGQPAKALSTLQPMLTGTPNADALALAAEAHLQSGDVAKSEAYFSQAAKADPGDAKIRTALALTQINKGNTDAGFAQLESVAAADRTNYADLALISARLRRNDLPAALAAADRLVAKMPDKPLPLHLRGRILMERKDAAGARAALEKALAIDPEYFPAVIALAELDIGDNKLDDARKRFEALLARNPKDSRALIAIANLRQRAGATPAEVGKLLDDAVKANPSESAPRLAQIEHLLARNDTKAALAAGQNALATNPDDLDTITAVGRTQLAAGDVQQAITSFGRVVSAMPASPPAYLNLAEAYVRNKDLGSAAQTLRRVLEFAPDFVPAQQGLIQIAIDGKRFDEALEIARSIQRQRPTEPTGYLLAGEIASRQKNWEAAIAGLRAALERSNTTPIAIRLQSLYTVAGRGPDADRFAAEWERAHPRDADFQFHLGTVAMERRDNVQAERRYRAVVDLRPNDASALNNLAWLLVQQGKPGAVPLAERANQLSPNMPALMDTLALAYAADNQLPKALEWQRKAVERAPDNTALRFGLAKLLVKSGARSAARAELETLSKLGPKFAQQNEVDSLLKSL